MALKYRSTAVFQKPDVKHDDWLVTKFINNLMHGGKKSTAERVFYEALDLVGQRIEGVESIEVFRQALNNVKPKLEVRSKRVGGATYQVPMQVAPNRAQALAIRWVLSAVRGRKGRPVARRLADELADAYNRQGTAYTQRENIHKMADANKAFAHFAW
jgi:small subunit ribosomal protein S7